MSHPPTGDEEIDTPAGTTVLAIERNTVVLLTPSKRRAPAEALRWQLAPSV